MATRTVKPKLTSEFKKAASSSSGRVHIVPSKGGWSVKKEGALRSTVVSPTKKEALHAASKIKYTERIVVHKKDGTIQSNKKKR